MAGHGPVAVDRGPVFEPRCEFRDRLKARLLLALLTLTLFISLMGSRMIFSRLIRFLTVEALSTLRLSRRVAGGPVAVKLLVMVTWSNRIRFLILASLTWGELPVAAPVVVV